MRRTTRSLLVLGLVLLLTLLSASLMAAQPNAPTSDDSPDLAGVNAPPTRSGAPVSVNPSGGLYDNGPLVNSPGTGPGGSDESIARNVTVGLTSRGFNVSASGGFRITDDFTIAGPASWQITGVLFYAYMGNSPTSPSPCSAVNYQIWNGPPSDPGSTVVFGDTTTNRLVSSTWANMYRRQESTPTDYTRPVFVLNNSAGVTLPPGHYWIDWQVDGDINYTGPWQPPVTIDGQTSTGDAQQMVSGVWQAIVDAGLQTPLGAPFSIEGTLVTPTAVELSSLQSDATHNLPWLPLTFVILLATALSITLGRRLAR